MRRKGRSRYEDDDDRPLARKRTARDEEDDDEIRPRRKKKRRQQEEEEGPWKIAILVTVGIIVVTFLGTLLYLGTAGLPESKDGPAIKVLALGFGLLVSGVLIGLGIVGVKRQESYGRWGIDFTGFYGVVFSMIQAALGGFLCGFILYGVFFTILHGR